MVSQYSATILPEFTNGNWNTWLASEPCSFCTTRAQRWRQYKKKSLKHRHLINMTSVVNSLCASCCLKSKISSSVTRSVTTLCHLWRRALIPGSCCHPAKLTRHTKPPRQPSPVRNAHFSTSRYWHCSTSPTIKSKHPHVLATSHLWDGMTKSLCCTDKLFAGLPRIKLRPHPSLFSSLVYGNRNAILSAINLICWQLFSGVSPNGMKSR